MALGQPEESAYGPDREGRGGRHGFNRCWWVEWWRDHHNDAPDYDYSADVAANYRHRVLTARRSVKASSVFVLLVIVVERMD